MKRDKTKCLLIWPPLAYRSTMRVPLGIPSLVAYLRKKGIDTINVFDMNIAYLQKLRFFWIIYIFHKRCHRLYHRLLEAVARAVKRSGHINPTTKQQGEYEKPDTFRIAERKTPFWRKAGLHCIRYIGKKVITFLQHIDKKVITFLQQTYLGAERSIPWSLKSIISNDLQDTTTLEKSKIYHILERDIFKRSEYSLVGISIVYPQQLFFALLIAKLIKEEFDKNIYIVFGGPQITKHINHLITSENMYAYVDFFITHDGEEPLLKLITDLPKKHFSKVPNLYFRSPDKTKGYENSGGTFFLHPKDILAPDFTDFDLNAYAYGLSVLASKGCFWSKCNFCTYRTIYENRHFCGTVDNTLKIIRELKKKYGVSKYQFVDDALPPKFMRKFAEGLIEQKLDIEWTTMSILVRDFTNKNLCFLLKKSGARRFQFGLESISPRILNLMNKYHKNLSESEIKEILKTLRNADITVGLNIIIGFPTETIDEARQTVDFVTKIRDLYRNCGIQAFSLEENTEVFNNPSKFGITKVYQEDKTSGRRLGYRYEVAHGMSMQEAEKFVDEAIKILHR
jgi:radical SAM superfamily enzyme YgiQ (UPF0313 family)